MDEFRIFLNSIQVLFRPFLSWSQKELYHANGASVCLLYAYVFVGWI